MKPPEPSFEEANTEQALSDSFMIVVIIERSILILLYIQQLTRHTYEHYSSPKLPLADPRNAILHASLTEWNCHRS